MQVADLGRLNGPVLLFGGPYSNLQATRAMRAEATRRGIPPERCICTGDIVAYCADPAETVAEIRDWGCVVVGGNCEKQLSAGAPDCGCGFAEGSACDLLSVGWYAHADAAIDTAARQWMVACPDLVTFQHAGAACIVCHGGFSDISRFLWPTSGDEDFLDELQHVAGPNSHPSQRFVLPDLVFSGHSGLPFERRIGDVRWVNAGVIGLPPNDGAPETRYAILDEGAVKFHRLAYDWQAARDAMQEMGLVQGYHEALETGWWPSEEVLPPELRRRA